MDLVGQADRLQRAFGAARVVEEWQGARSRCAAFGGGKRVEGLSAQSVVDRDAVGRPGFDGAGAVVFVAVLERLQMDTERIDAATLLISAPARPP
jgi:hypothetical protein